MSDTHKTKPWYVQVAMENSKKIKRGFQVRSNDRHKLEHTGQGWKVERDHANAEEADELGIQYHDSFRVRAKRFGKHNTANRKARTVKKRAKVKQQIKHEQYDDINNRGTERHDAAWYD